MFRPHISSAPAHRPVRRGTILIVVLALLALFAVIALFFVFFADAEATNARIMREAESYNGNDAAALDQSAFDAANVGLSQMIFGVPFNQLSGLYGQDLTTLMYTHLPGQSPPFAGIGTFHEPVPGIGTADRATWVNYSAFAYGAGGVPFFLDPEWSGSRSPSNPVQGAAWWSAGPSSAFGQTFIPKNAGYTYPDLNNFILASISPATGQVLVPSLHRPWLFNLAPQGFGGNAQDWLAGEGRTRTVRPRPVDQLTAAELQSIIGVPYLPATLNAAQIASLNNYIQSQIAQGNLIGYPPPNADSSFTGDVQNLVGGVGVQRNDSILVDLGLPPRQWNGKWVKPLVSILVSDLDGLLNLNVHGNVRNNGGPGSGLHASFHGLGPHEVNLGSPSNVFGGPLLNSEAQNLVFARYGSAGAATARNGGPFGNNTYFYDRSGSRIKQESQVNFDGGFAGIVPQLFLPSFASSNAFQVSPSYGTAGQSFYDDNVYDGAVMSPPAGYVADSYNKYDKHPLLFNPNDYGPNNTGAPRTFGFGDFKRFNFKYAATLDWYQQTNMYNPSGLANASLIGTFPANNAYRLDPAHTRRMMATMRSSGFDRPSLAPNFLTVQGPSGMTPSQALNFLQPVNPLASTPPPTGGMPYPSQAMYPQTPYPGTSPAALPPTPGQISDYQAMDFRHVRAGYGAGLGGIDLNRPLTSYYPPNTAPTPLTTPVNLTQIPQVAQAWADRHNLARDIFARLIVATGATAIVDPSTGNITLPQPTGPGANTFQLNTLTVTQVEYNALRYLAQMSANMVDLIDNDDINTPFIWNPPGGVLTQVNSTNVATLQTSLMAVTTINNTNAVSDRMVFGVEKPKLIINEAYGEITNDPSEQTTANAAPMFAAHVRFWVELINPGNAAYANNGNGPQGAPLPTPATPGNGAAQVRYEAADGVTTPYSPYNLTITRFNKTGTVAGTTENVRQYLQDPSNVLGAYMPPGGTPADLIYDFSNNVNAANSGRIVSPNNGQYGPNLTPAQGCLIVGPQVPPAQMAGNMTGPQPFEFTPQAAVAPWAQMYQSPQQIGVMPQAAPSNLMEYLIPIPASGQGMGSFLGNQDFAQHVVLLSRLANPYMLPNDPTSGAFNSALPANPYITVDYMDYVPAFDAVNRTMNESTNNQRQPKAGGPPPSGVNAYDPMGYRFSVGKIQPFASLSFPANATTGPTANTTFSSASYSYLTSCVLPQIPVGFNAAASTVPAFSFGRHNGTQNTDLYTPRTSTALPNNTSETILAPFDWFVHFDRPLINQMELLHLQACKPHEVTQFTTQPMVPAPAGPGPMAPAVNYMKNLGVAQWFGVNSTGFSGYDTTNNRTNNGLFRALEVLRVKPWMYGVGSGGRTQGQVNINTAQDPRILQSVLDGVPPQWAANTPYQQGQLVSNGGSAYVCITAGTSGPTGPTGFTSPIVDGSVQWSYYRPAGNGFTVNDVASLWNNGFNSPAPTAGIPYRTRNCTTAASPFPAPFSQGQLANGQQLNVPIPGKTIDDASPGDPNIATYDRPFKPFGYPEFSTGGLYGMSAGSGLQDTLLRINPANSNPLFWVNNPTLNGVSMPHPYMKAEMLRKMFNNSTTVSNAFAVTMTVVFYEVRSNGSGGYLTVADGGGVVQRPALGKEAFVYAPGDLRQQFYAVVDRTMIGIQPSGTGWQPQPFFTSLGAATPTALTAAGLSPGTMVPILPAPTTPPMGFLPPQFPNSFNVYLDNDGPSPSGPAQPYTTNYASTGTIYSNGFPITIGPGTTLVIGSGTNQEVVGVNYVNQDGSVNVSTVPGKQHAVGEVVSNCLLGNPGLPGITPGMPAFDRFTNPSSSNFTSVVPYVWRKPKE